MSDPTTLGIASSAVAIVNGTISLLKEARDAAKRSDDHDLKDKLSEVYDAVLELKDVIVNLREQNDELAQKLNFMGQVKRIAGYTFVDGDDDEICSRCAEIDRRVVHLKTLVFDKTGKTAACPQCKTPSKGGFKPMTRPGADEIAAKRGTESHP